VIVEMHQASGGSASSFSLIAASPRMAALLALVSSM